MLQVNKTVPDIASVIKQSENAKNVYFLVQNQLNCTNCALNCGQSKVGVADKQNVLLLFLFFFLTITFLPEGDWLGFVWGPITQH